MKNQRITSTGIPLSLAKWQSLYFTKL